MRHARGRAARSRLARREGTRDVSAALEGRRWTRGAARPRPRGEHRGRVGAHLATLRGGDEARTAREICRCRGVLRDVGQVESRGLRPGVPRQEQQRDERQYGRHGSSPHFGPRAPCWYAQKRAGGPLCAAPSPAAGHPNVSPGWLRNKCECAQYALKISRPRFRHVRFDHVCTSSRKLLHLEKAVTS